MQNSNKEKNHDRSKFDLMFKWLRNDEESAAKAYTKIRNALIKKFTVRGSVNAEDLADETIDRVASKSKWLIREYKGEPLRYFFGVARNVFLESTRNNKMKILSQDLASKSIDELAPEVLDYCLSKSLRLLPKHEKMFILDYYKGEKSAKIERRKRMCERFGLLPEALRIRAFRIRSKLKLLISEELKATVNDNQHLDVRAAFANSMRQKLSQIPAAHSDVKFC